MGGHAGDVDACPLADIAFELSFMARKMLEPIWPKWKRAGGHHDPDRLASEDACVVSSLALRSILAHALPEYRWQAVGGRPTLRTPHGGYHGPDGQGGCHMWVEGLARRGRGLEPGGRIVADITADQFGGPEVLVLEGASPHHRANYSRPILAFLRAAEPEHVALWVALFDANMRAATSRHEGAAR